MLIGASAIFANNGLSWPTKLTPEPDALISGIRIALDLPQSNLTEPMNTPPHADDGPNSGSRSDSAVDTGAPEVVVMNGTTVPRVMTSLSRGHCPSATW